MQFFGSSIGGDGAKPVKVTVVKKSSARKTQNSGLVSSRDQEPNKSKY